jgi:hypothetical protein
VLITSLSLRHSTPLVVNMVILTHIYHLISSLQNLAFDPSEHTSLMGPHLYLRGLGTTTSALYVDTSGGYMC